MRIFFKSGSTITEISNQLNKYKTDEYEISFTTTDAIYLACDFPMNHFYLKFGTTVNLISADLTIETWNGNTWNEVVNKNDYTNGFENSGFIDFTPDRDNGWSMSSSNANGQSVTGLENVTVYDKYWVKITTNTNMTSSIDLKWLGNLFSDDYDLYSEYSIFNDSNFLTGYEAGKTSWEEQHVRASELIIQDLKRKKVILGKEQILERDVFMPASICKVAEIIYNAFGKDYTDQKKSASGEYEKRMDLSQFVVDQNNNGVKDDSEVKSNQGWTSR